MSLDKNVNRGYGISGSFPLCGIVIGASLIAVGYKNEDYLVGKTLGCVCLLAVAGILAVDYSEQIKNFLSNSLSSIGEASEGNYYLLKRKILGKTELNYDSLRFSYLH